MSLYAVSVLGTALSAVAIYVLGDKLGYPIEQMLLYGCMGGIFGLLIAIGVLYGDTEFLLFFAHRHQGKYLAAIYALITFAMLFGQNRIYAFAQLGGALAGLLYIRLAPRRGVSLRDQRVAVRAAQQLLPLEAPPRRTQVRGLHAQAGPHSQLRQPWPPDRRRSQRQEPLELGVSPLVTALSGLVLAGQEIRWGHDRDATPRMHH